MTETTGEFRDDATKKIDIDAAPESGAVNEEAAAPAADPFPELLSEPGRLPLSVSVETAGGMLLTIARIGDVLPVKCTREFSVGSDVITDVAINIYAGERALASYNKKIGTLAVSGIEKLSNGKPMVTISFEIDRDCSISVEAIDEGSLKKITKKIDPSWIPSDDEILKIVKDARDNLAKDNETRINCDIISKARDVLYRLDAGMKEKRKTFPREKLKEIKATEKELKKKLKKLDVQNMEQEQRKEINTLIASLD